MAAPIAYAAELVAIVRRCLPLVQALEAARSLQLTSWCIGAGAVRNRVWDHLHGLPVAQSLGEVDLVFYDPDRPVEHDEQLQHMLSQFHPMTRWDVTNQAHVHRWYSQSYGAPVEPVLSLEAGIATWPEFATCVGLTLHGDDTLTAVAPFGLHDLFNLQLRHNPARASAAVFADRLRSKRWLELWPALKVTAAAENAA